MINPKRSLVSLLLLMIAPSPLHLRAQTAKPPIDAAVSQIAGRLCSGMEAAHVRKVVFADLKGPNGEVHPVGMWLADQLGNSCSRDFPSLEIILRSSAETENRADFEKNPPKSVEDWARRVGAKIVVTGSFARLANGLGISLAAMTAADEPSTILEVKGLIPVTGEMAALSPRLIPAPAGQTPRAGIGGFGVPQCIYCPPPTLSRKSRVDPIEGSVVLESTINSNGRATNISVTRSLREDLDEEAVKTVAEWKFRPAAGPDGKPTAVLVPIEVTFRLR